LEKMQNSQIQGKLLNAVIKNGDKALWNIAQGEGPAADKAREVIELSTSPIANLTTYEAINLVFKKS